jgi:hypothetical protein
MNVRDGGAIRCHSGFELFLMENLYFHAIFHGKFITQYVCPCNVDLGILVSEKRAER